MLAIYCRSKRWVINLRRDDLANRSPEYLYKNCTVCSEHFEPIMFMNDLRNRFYSHAIPTIVNFSNPPKSVMISRPLPHRQMFTIETPKKIQKKEECTETFVETATERESADLPCNSSSAPQLQQTVLPLLSVSNQMSPTSSTLSSSTSRKANFQSKLHFARVVSSLRKKRLAIVEQRLLLLRKHYCVKNVVNSSVESIVNAAKPMLSSDCLKRLEVQIRMAKRCPRGRRYNDNGKQFALNL